VVGKYITNNLFVSYERNFGSAIEQDNQLAEYEMTLEYELFRYLFLQLTSSPIKNGFDVVFKVTVP
jgi:translocation and assembly module TamB